MKPAPAAIFENPAAAYTPEQPLSELGFSEQFVIWCLRVQWRVAEDGAAIIVELWDVPQARFGEFVAEIPPPLGIGNLELADGRWVKGFICEPYALDGARDITSFGGWRAYIASLQAAKN